MRAVVLLNSDAGTMRSPGKTQHIVSERFTAGGWSAQVYLVPSDAMGNALGAAMTSSADTIVVGGGDGSVSRAVATMEGSDKALGILPLGTVNLLGRDLGMPNELESAVDVLCNSEIRTIDLATLNGGPFHSVSGLGFFAHMARERERVRRRWRLPRWIGFAVAAARALSKIGTVRLEIETDPTPRTVVATALLVTNNRFCRAGWGREHVDEGVLEVHVLGELPFWKRLRAGIDVVRGRWRENPLIETRTTTSLIVRSRRRRRLWVTLDGELTRVRMPLHYGIRRAALKVLAPASEVPKQR